MNERATRSAGEIRATRPDAFRVLRRTPTLDGNVPLRAASACAPYLAGNAFGAVLATAAPIVVRRGLRAIEATSGVRARSIDGRTVALSIDTGLAVAPADGVIVVVERAYNRRDRRVAIEPSEIAAARAPTPIVLEVRLALGRGDEARLDGELATLSPFAVAPEVRWLQGVDARPLARAHLDFFDRAYFEDKREGPTRKYRTSIASTKPPARDDEGACAIELALLGGARPRVTRSAAGVLRVELAVELPITLTFHGQRIEPRLDRAALARRAEGIAASLRALFGEEIRDDTGALLYFTSYVTAHTAGDPHLFFKPATLLRTPPGWHTVLDGPAHDAWEGLRGVVASDRFHAIPAVVEMLPGRVTLAAGTLVGCARPVPAWLLDAGFESTDVDA